MGKSKHLGPSNSESEENYLVEKILNKRIKDGKVEYYLQWSNSWEPADNLDCPDLIAEFEEAHKKKEEKNGSNDAGPSSGECKSSNSSEDTEKTNNIELEKKKEEKTKETKKDDSKDKDNKDRKEINNEKDTKNETSDKKIDEKQKGFERGLEPERVVGISDEHGPLMYLMKYKGTDDADLVHAAEANKKCLQIMIKYWESNFPNFK